MMLLELTRKELMERVLLVSGMILLLYFDIGSVWLIFFLSMGFSFLHEKSIKTRIQLDNLKAQIDTLKAEAIATQASDLRDL